MAQEHTAKEFSELDFADIQWSWFEDYFLKYKKESSAVLKWIIKDVVDHLAFQRHMELYIKDDGKKKLLEEWQGVLI